MTEQVRDNAERGRYELPAGNATAFAEYIPAGDVRIVTHTEVPHALSGRGIGSTLVRGMLEDMRARGLRIAPRCSFVVDFIRRHPEYADLRAEPGPRP
ncbi:MAG: N-acetyltransferase [Rhodospirillales bacterium]|nr:N-acetyltransferase [Rhodospirillales bacterium]